MLVYSHCPLQAEWQLIQPAVSQSEYESYPLVKSFFFVCGMQFTRDRRGVVVTKRGVATISLGFSTPTSFTFRLVYEDSDVDKIQVP